MARPTSFEAAQIINSAKKHSIVLARRNKSKNYKFCLPGGGGGCVGG